LQRYAKNLNLQKFFGFLQGSDRTLA
jgi:hypothetical protein